MLLTCLRAVLRCRHGNVRALKVLQVIFWLALLLQPSRFLCGGGGGQLLLIGGMSIPICNIWDF